MTGLSAEGALTAATTCLRMRGEANVFLRLPLPAVAGDDGEQLGLGSPLFSDVPLWPATWRKAGRNEELLVGAECVRTLMGTEASVSAESLFSSAAGLVVGEVLYAIQGSFAITAAGVPVAYRISVEGPARG